MFRNLSRRALAFGIVAVLGLPGFAVAAEPASTGLGQAWPNATDVSLSPHYHVYVFRRVLRGGDAAIQRWIDAQLENRTCTIVLIGAETANRRWVKYEIEKSWDSGKGLFGIRIHKILDHNQQPSIAGANPFDGFSLENGRKLSTLAKVYDPPCASSADVYDYVSKNLAGWIETAIADR